MTELWRSTTKTPFEDTKHVRSNVIVQRGTDGQWRKWRPGAERKKLKPQLCLKSSMLNSKALDAADAERKSHSRPSPVARLPNSWLRGGPGRCIGMDSHTCTQDWGTASRVSHHLPIQSQSRSLLQRDCCSEIICNRHGSRLTASPTARRTHRARARHVPSEERPSGPPSEPSPANQNGHLSSQTGPRDSRTWSAL